MTVNRQQQIKELLSLTQSYLLSEYKGKEWIMTDPETYQFFKKFQPTQTPPKPVQQLQPKKTVIKATPPPTQATVTPPPVKSLPTKADKIAIPTSPPPQKEKIVESLPSTSLFSFKRDPVEKIEESYDFTSIKKELEKLFPNNRYTEVPPIDGEAKKVRNRWEKKSTVPEVVILSFSQSAEEQKFLQNVSQAIDQQLASSVIYSALAIEKQQAWERLFSHKELRLLITSDYGMFQLPGLMKYYKESPDKKGHFLGERPLLLIPEVSIYLKQPHLKAALWKALRTMLPPKEPS